MVSEFSKLPLSDLQRDWSGTTPIFKISTFYHIFASCSNAGWLKWCSFPHQHWRQHSSAQDPSGQGFSPDPSSQVGSGVQTKSNHSLVRRPRSVREPGYEASLTTRDSIKLGASFLFEATVLNQATGSPETNWVCDLCTCKGLTEKNVVFEQCWCSAIYIWDAKCDKKCGAVVSKWFWGHSA